MLRPSVPGWKVECIGDDIAWMKFHADGRLYLHGENGEVALVEPSPEGYPEKGRFTPPDRSGKKSWPHPVIAGARLYLRDQDVLLCYGVKTK